MPILVQGVMMDQHGARGAGNGSPVSVSTQIQLCGGMHALRHAHDVAIRIVHGKQNHWLAQHLGKVLPVVCETGNGRRQMDVVILHKIDEILAMLSCPIQIESNAGTVSLTGRGQQSCGSGKLLQHVLHLVNSLVTAGIVYHSEFVIDHTLTSGLRAVVHTLYDAAQTSQYDVLLAARYVALWVSKFSITGTE